MKRLVLIDRDGTINVERNYLSDPEQIELFPGVADGIRILRELNLRVVVVTNQSGVGRGLFDLKTLDKIHHRLREDLQKNGADIDAVYFCPHTPEDNCNCRKPLTEMAEKAAEDFNVALSQSFVIGDKSADIELGKNIGATTILVRTGYGKQVEQDKISAPDHIADDLFAAAGLIKEILEKDKNALKG